MAATVDESETCASGLSAVELGSVRLATAPASILDVAYAKFGDKEPISSKVRALSASFFLSLYAVYTIRKILSVEYFETE